MWSQMDADRPPRRCVAGRSRTSNHIAFSDDRSMTNSQRLASVRERFLQWLLDAEDVQTAADPAQASIRRESILIRDEFYCGRRFHTDLYDAVWFIEEDELKIFRADGSLAASLQGSELDASKPVESKTTETEGSTEPQILKLPLSSDPDQADGGDQEIRRAA